MTEAAPLALYVHWPYCARICPYCDFNVVRARGRKDEEAALAAAIIADLDAHRTLTGPRTLTSIFFGGGTPSLMAPHQVAAVIDTATGLWSAAPDLEISLEANPTDGEATHFAGLAGAGVQRLSLGLQSLDDVSLAFLGRNHGAAEGLRAADQAANLFPRLSVDLIYALPGQTTQVWSRELRTVAGLGAEHISPYQLTIEAGTAFDRAVRRGAWTPPDEEQGAALYETTQAVLEGLGYEAYEVSNHARGEAARSRHNLAYWRGWDYVGVGPGAHGRITLDGARTATEAARSIGDYLSRVREGIGWTASEALSPREAAIERLLMGLRTHEGVPVAELAALPLDPEKVAELTAGGLLRPGGDRLVATREGRAVLDRLTAELAG